MSARSNHTRSPPVVLGRNGRGVTADVAVMLLVLVLLGVLVLLDVPVLLDVLLGEMLAREPNNANALNFLGYSYADRGIELDKAEEMIRKALTIKPQDGYILDSLGWVLYQKKQYKKARLQSIYIKIIFFCHLLRNIR